MIREWSEGEVVALKFMWRIAGMSAHQIGAILKRSHCSIIGKVARLGMCDQGRIAPGGVARWAPFENPRYRPEDDPTHNGKRQAEYLPAAKILPLPGVNLQA